MMPENGQATAPSIFPILSYRDAPAAIEWLVDAFAFARGTVVPNPDGTIAHAELHLGTGVVMLNSVKGDGGSANLRPSDHGVYIALDDVDDHFARAKANGAEILAEPFDTSYGSRDYFARDPEGFTWYFGTYRPE